MKYAVTFDVAAQADLADLYDYLLPRAGERVADAYVNALLDYCESFAKFPERGTRHDNIQPGLRTVGYRRRATVAFGSRMMS